MFKSAVSSVAGRHGTSIDRCRHDCVGTRRIILILLAAVLYFPVAVFAQEVFPASEPVAIAVPARPDGLRETFDKYPNSSAASLVGLALGEAPDIRRDMSIFLPLPISGGVLCVRTVTQDARYFALNPYRITNVPRTARFVRVLPIAERHAKQLIQYNASEFAIRAYLSEGDTCQTRNAIHLPQIGDRDNVLIALINGNSRNGVVELFDTNVDIDTEPGEPASSGTCTDAGMGARIAFDLKCKLPVPRMGNASEVYLRLTLDDGFQEERQVYRVLMPGKR